MKPKLRSLDSLKSFVCAAKLLSISAAAKELSITPGAVSQRIKQLEEDLGVQLFERKKQRVHLTQKGHELFETSMQALSALNSVVDRISSKSSNQLSIGASTYFTSRWLSQRLMGFMDVNQRLKLDTYQRVKLNS